MKALLPFLFCALGSILTALNADRLNSAPHVIMFALGIQITFLSLAFLGTRGIRRKRDAERKKLQNNPDPVSPQHENAIPFRKE